MAYSSNPLLLQQLQSDPYKLLDALVKQGEAIKLPNGEYTTTSKSSAETQQLIPEGNKIIKTMQPPNPYNYSGNTSTTQAPINYAQPAQSAASDPTSLANKIKLRDSQIQFFGSADPTLLKEIAALQQTQPQANPGVAAPVAPPPVQPTAATTPVPAVPNPVVQPPQPAQTAVPPTTPASPTLASTLPPEAIAAALAQQTAQTQASTPSAPTTIQLPTGGIEAGPNLGGRDEAKLLAEAELQKQLRQQAYDETNATRKKMLTDLSTLLVNQQKAQLQDALPGMYEDLNTRGLLRSSALGDRVSTEQAKLARQTSEQLALQGLSDDKDALNSLGGIEESYLSGRSNAIARRFSLEDYATQFAASKELGAAMTPVAQSGQSAKGGALQGGVQGAAAGSAAGPWGAAIGGAAGLVLGSQASGGK